MQSAVGYNGKSADFGLKTGSLRKKLASVSTLSFKKSCRDSMSPTSHLSRTGDASRTPTKSEPRLQATP